MFEALEGAWERRDLLLPNLNYMACFLPYQADPRFRNLLRRMNLG